MKIAKKALALSMAAMMALGLAACGGGDGGTASPSPSATPSVEQSTTPSAEVSIEPSDVPDASAPQSSNSTGYTAEELEAAFDEAYMGVSESGEAMFYAGDNALTNAMLMFYNADSNTHYVFVGPVTANDDGSMTITDREDGLTLTFNVTPADGGIILEMGDLGKGMLEEAGVVETIEAMMQVESASEPVTPGSSDGGSSEEQIEAIISGIEESLTEAYVGEAEDESMIYLGANDDGTYCTIVVLGDETSNSTIFSGAAEMDDDGIVTVTDEISGNTLRFAMAEEGGELHISIENVVDDVVLEECTVDDLITVITLMLSA